LEILLGNILEDNPWKSYWKIITGMPSKYWKKLMEKTNKTVNMGWTVLILV